MATPVKYEVGRGRVTALEVDLQGEEVLTDSVDATQDVNVAKARIGDVVSVTPHSPGIESIPVYINAYVSANDVVTLQFVNASGSTVDLSSVSAHMTVFHRN